MDTKPFYRAYLHTAFAAEKYNHDQVSAMLDHFDKMCEKTLLPETAFAVAIDQYGNECPEKACRTVAEYIAKQMGKYNATHAGIPTQNRLRDLIKRFNNSIDALSSLTVDGKGLDDAERERIKIHMPYAASKTYTATASETHSNAKARAAKSLSLEVIMY